MFTDDHAIRCDGCGNPIYAGESFWKIRAGNKQFNACTYRCIGTICEGMSNVSVKKDRLYTAEEKAMEYADRQMDGR